MTFKKWLNWWKMLARSPRTGNCRRSGKTRSRTRPEIELLEDRTALTVSLTNSLPWSPQGPAPILGEPLVFAGSDSAASGAVESLVVKQFRREILPEIFEERYVAYAGTVNGGVWRSDNIADLDPTQVRWQPLTDDQRSLATSSLALDPRDDSGNTLWVGTGPLSSYGSNNNLALQAVGLLKTIDGGNTWTQFGKGLAGQRILRVVPTAIIDPFTHQQVVLVACGDGKGVMWSNDGGQTFQPAVIPGPFIGSTLPLTGIATDLVEDPNDPSRFYAAVVGQGIYESNASPSGEVGRLWVPINDPILPIATSFNFKLAVANDNGTTLLDAAVGAKVPQPDDPTKLESVVAGVFQASISVRLLPLFPG